MRSHRVIRLTGGRIISRNVRMLDLIPGCSCGNWWQAVPSLAAEPGSLAATAECRLTSLTGERCTTATSQFMCYGLQVFTVRRFIKESGLKLCNM